MWTEGDNRGRTDTGRITQAMEQAEAAILELDPENWSRWVIWLLDAMDEHTDNEPDFIELLQSLQSEIQGRIDTGRW